MSPEYPVLLRPGEYNEGVLRGLDYLLSEAGRRGLKVGCWLLPGAGAAAGRGAASGPGQVESCARPSWRCSCPSCPALLELPPLPLL